MFIANVALSYGDQGKIKALSDEDFTEFCRRFKSWGESITDKEGNRKDSFYLGDQIADNDDCQWLMDRGFSIEMKRLKGLTGFAGYRPPPAGEPYITQVHVPNVGLFAVDEVQLLQDACTDALQGELNDGWRILAVCPPNSQRRPDYILGRSKK